MKDKLTVFYSWQSDTPNNLNRSFIEKALEGALKQIRANVEIEKAIRETAVEIDQGTKNVPGSPPVAETILQKITNCAAFLADLTVVGKSLEELVNPGEAPRRIQNPNVLIEYGYALHCHSDRIIIGVMNTAYGDEENLPFDLRHRRWPITYKLEDPEDPEKVKTLERLTKEIENAMRVILQEQKNKNATPFTPHVPTTSKAWFFQTGSEPVPGKQIPREGAAYLRVYPESEMEPIKNEFTAEQLAGTMLKPLGKATHGWVARRNEFGAVSYETSPGPDLLSMTQLFLNREIWGLDAGCVNAKLIEKRYQELEKQGFPKYDPKPFIASGLVENSFTEALANYLAFAKIRLNLPLPLKVKAGLVGIKGLQIAVSAQEIAGGALQDTVEWEGEVESYETAPTETLRGFFELMWENCGLGRPVDRT